MLRLVDSAASAARRRYSSDGVAPSGVEDIMRGLSCSPCGPLPSSRDASRDMPRSCPVPLMPAPVRQYAEVTLIVEAPAAATVPAAVARAAAFPRLCYMGSK